MSRERNYGAVDPELRSFKRDLYDSATKFTGDAGSATIYQVEPPNNRITDPTPVAVFEGFGKDRPMVRRMHEVVRSGRPLIALQQIETTGDSTRLEDAKKADLALEVFSQDGRDRYDFLGISGGGGTAVHALIKEPSIVRDTGLVNASLTGRMEGLELTFRFAMKKTSTEGLSLRDPDVDPSAMQAFLEFGWHVLSNPRRTIREIRGIAKTDLYALCEKAAKLGKRIFVITAEDDNIFPFSEIQKRMEMAGHNRETAPFELHTVPGRHDEPLPLVPARTKMALELFAERNTARSNS